MPSVLNEPYFNDEHAAFDELEKLVWPHGPVCPFCGNMVGACIPYPGFVTKPSKKHPNGLERPTGCASAESAGSSLPFARGPSLRTAPSRCTFGSRLTYSALLQQEGSRAPNQLSRTLGVTLQTAWFMWHRIREAMRAGGLASMGGDGRDLRD